MDSRCAQILVQLRNSGVPITVKQLSADLHVSQRTVSYDLKKIDQFLISEKLPKLVRTKAGISTNFTARHLPILNYTLLRMDNYQYVLAPEERKQYILADLIANRNYTTIQQLAAELCVSRNTIMSDLKEIREYLSPFNIFIDSKKHEGVRIVGEEKKIRRILFSIISEHFQQETMVQDIQNQVVNHKELGLEKKFLNIFTDIDIHFIEKCIQAAEHELNLLFSDTAYSGIVLHIAMAIKRIQGGKDITISANELETLSKTREFSVASSIAGMLGKQFHLEIPMDEIGYITVHLLGASSIQNGNGPSNPKYEILTQSIIGSMSRLLGNDLSGDRILYQGLIDHIGPVLYRLQHDTQLRNPLMKEIRENYQELLTKMQAALAPVEKFTGGKVTHDEAGYFVLHIAAALERKKQAIIQKTANVLVICSTGIGSSQILSTRLQMIFNVHIVACIGIHRANDFLSRHPVDLVVSTIPASHLGVETIIVNPLLKEKDIHKLRPFLKPKRIREDKQIYLKIMDVVTQNCRIIDENKLRRELKEVLDQPHEKEGKVLMLKEILTKDVIQTQVRVSDWEDAIRQCGRLLVRSDIADESYVDAMVQSVKTIGPYIVVAPGIAMPHARPEAGAKKTGFSLMTLSHPVPFGNKENDPVVIVVCICSADHTSHIKALSELVNLFGDEQNVQKIKSAATPEEVVNIIQNSSNII